MEHAAEGGQEGGLAAPGTAADSYTLPPWDGDGGPPPPQIDEGVGTTTKTATKTMMDFIFRKILENEKRKNILTD